MSVSDQGLLSWQRPQRCFAQPFRARCLGDSRFNLEHFYGWFFGVCAHLGQDAPGILAWVLVEYFGDGLEVILDRSTGS